MWQSHIHVKLTCLCSTMTSVNMHSCSVSTEPTTKYHNESHVIYITYATHISCTAFYSTLTEEPGFGLRGQSSGCIWQQLKYRFIAKMTFVCNTLHYEVLSVSV